MSSQFFTNQWTSSMQKLLREVMSDPKTFIGARFLPSVVHNAAVIRTEVLEATGGMTNEHVLDTNPKYIGVGGSRVQEFSPGFWKEAVHYNEEKIIFLRKLGEQDTSLRGIEMELERGVDRLNRRVETKMEKLRWDTIFNGGWTFAGRTVSFGVPAGNRAVPVGALWSLDGVSANASANPLLDLRYWLLGGLPAYRKYKVTGAVMNPNTARWIMDNENTRTFLTSYGANPALPEFDLNRTMQLLSPGLPTVEVYGGWYQDESEGADGHITVSDAKYFIPDGMIYFPSALPDQDKIGEFTQTLSLANGGTTGLPGKFIVFEDNTVPGSKGGPGNPFIDIVGGVYGGPKLDRAFDLLTAKVVA